jgi:2-amino-4-hydroxy-6-hydroxymethyldihydropteridine diphosphokinase
VSAGKMIQALIGFGSNLGNGRQLILSAWNRLTVEEEVDPCKFSSLYITKAVGMTSRFLFTNGVGMVETALGPLELLRLLLRVETEHGRVRDVHASGYQDRLLDLDLLYFGDTVCSSPELSLPHPHIASRLFVLAPLAQIAPWFLDPLTGQTVAVMYQQLLVQIQQGTVPAQSVSRIERAE